MKHIELTKGKRAIVDDEDYESISRHKWYYHSEGYAARRDADNKMLMMHRVIMDTPKGMYTDHINHDRLDNRRKNLRICTNSQNLFYRPSKSRSGLKGVDYHKGTGKWRVRLHVKRKEHHIGLFASLEQARQAYNTAALELHGEYAWLNK